MVNSDEYVKITLSNKGIMTNPLDKNDNLLPPILDKSQLSNIDKHFKAFERALQSATNYMVYINDNFKKIDEVTGEAVKSYFLKKSDLANVLPALQRANAQLKLGSYLADPNDTRSWKASSYLDDMKVEDMKMLTFKRKRAGKVAQSLAEEAVDKMGGTSGFASPKDREKEMMSFSLPVTEDEINALGGMKEARKFYAKKLDAELKMSTKYSKTEMKARNFEQEQEEEKRTQKLTEEDNRNKTALLIKGIAILLSIATIARRILTSILNRATEDTKNAQDSVRYSVSPVDAIAYKRMERARGLEEGTTLSAIQTVQTKFGQTDKIGMDNQDLKTLAPVIGDKVAGLVVTGLGKTKPEELTKMIIDSFYKMANEGKIWTGEYVGKDNASRILTDRLSQFSPDMANILATMLYLNNRSTEYRGKITGFEDLINLGGEQSEYTLKTRIMEDLGIEITELTAKFKTLKENILDKLGVSLAKFIDWINNNELFMSAKDKSVRRRNARESLKEVAKTSLQEAEKEEAIAESIIASKGKSVADLGYSSVEELYNSGFSGVGSIFTIEDKRRIQKSVLLAKKWREKSAKAQEERGLSNPQYNPSEYNPFVVLDEVMEEMFHTHGNFVPLTTNEILSAYASTYDGFSALDLLTASKEDNVDLINMLAKKYNLGGWKYETKKENVINAYKSGTIRGSDIKRLLESKLLGGKAYTTWQSNYKLGLNQERVNFAYSVAQENAREKLEQETMMEAYIANAIAKMKSEGKLNGSYTVKGAYYDPKAPSEKKIKVIFDINGKEFTAFETSTYDNFSAINNEFNINRMYADSQGM